LKNRSFGAVSSFGEQLLVTTFGSYFAEWLWGALLWDAAFGSNFEEQLRGATVGINFAALQPH